MHRRTGRLLVGIAALSLLAGALFVMQAGAVAPANEHFQRTWARTDLPVSSGQVSRTWMWGPDGFTGELQETYAEAPGGQRSVQYFDKARMEITQPDADAASVWYVTNGLLVVELITGRLQVGDADFEQRNPASVNVAGDADDPTGPSYATFDSLLASPALPSNQAITQRVDRSGNVSIDTSLAGYGIMTSLVDDVTNHAIAVPFWNFMTSSGTVWDGAAYAQAPLFENAYFATGRPITEAYWARVKVAGTYQDVLMQCFERRCLTYNPANAPEWQVEAGNVGRHYYAWRYEQPGGSPTATPTATSVSSPVPSVSPSASPSETPDTATEYQSVEQWGAPKVASSFFAPNSVSIDAAGDVWITDSTTQRVIKLNADGLFQSTFGSIGIGDGQFNSATGVARDSLGNIYVADTGNHRIQKFNANGGYITQWGKLGAGDGDFNSPHCVVIHDDIVYVCDRLNHRIQRFSLAGVYMDQWGASGSGPGQFKEVWDIAFDEAGNSYVADFANSRIQKFDSLRNYAGQFSENELTGAIIGPTGVAIDTNGVIYVTDGFHRIARFAANGEALEDWSKQGVGIGELDMPWGIAVGLDGRVYVANYGLSRLQVFSPTGQGLFLVNSSNYGRIGLPGDIAFDGSLVLVLDSGTPDSGINYYRHDGSNILNQPFNTFGEIPGGPIEDANGLYTIDGTDMYVVDGGKDRVLHFVTGVDEVDVIGSSGSGPGQLSNPSDLAIDADDRLYVVDSGNHRVQVFDAEGDFITGWGSLGAEAGQFDEPTGIVIAGESLYVTDTGNHRVQRFTLDGDHLGSWGSVGAGEGQFAGPVGIAVDAEGYVYIADTGNDRIQKFTAEGIFITAWGSSGTEPGQFDEPWGIAVYENDNVYVTERGNYRVQVFEPGN